MSCVHPRDLGFQRHQPEDREPLSRNRRPGRGHLLHSGGWQDIQEISTHSSIHITIQTETTNRRTGRIWTKFFSSTNSSKTFFNGAWTTRGSTWHTTGQNLEQVARRSVSKR
ncbi:hypothetical protein O181_088304 [Austropuccinia psidii MF-1]|uniref:Uncharacterized protein n=1 Tax=Austropuccinia psidii MF-1 TaxID=1389203 RepID=A0A9Q3IRG0_9BASI|nr:hypothetical protein [Austropuccinia psidii MF-1]